MVTALTAPRSARRWRRCGGSLTSRCTRPATRQVVQSQVNSITSCWVAIKQTHRLSLSLLPPLPLAPHQADDAPHQNQPLAKRLQVAKAQEAVAGTEDRMRAAEAVERSRLEADCVTKLSAQSAEMERREQEQARQMSIMNQEMLRWRQQAHYVAAAVLEAKNELLDRRHELSATNERMDSLVEKLYAGRDHGMDLQGAIGAYYRMAAASSAGQTGWQSSGGQVAVGLLPALPGLEESYGGGQRATKGRQSQAGGTAAAAAAGGGGTAGRLPALTARGGGGALGRAGAAASAGAAANHSKATASPPHQRLPQIKSPGAGAGSYAQLHSVGPAYAAPAANRRHSEAAGKGAAAGGGYSHVPSRVFEAAAAYSATAGAEAKVAGKAPDRFAETAKTAAGMTAAVGTRWQ
jgi:hypothetical protein